jgi:hypothetical protein
MMLRVNPRYSRSDVLYVDSHDQNSPQHENSDKHTHKNESKRSYDSNENKNTMSKEPPGERKRKAVEEPEVNVNSDYHSPKKRKARRESLDSLMTLSSLRARPSAALLSPSPKTLPQDPGRPLYSSDQSSRSGSKYTGSDSRDNGSRNSTDETSVDPDRYDWKPLWKRLEKDGWSFGKTPRNKRNILAWSWCYVRPGCDRRTGTEGIDYFLYSEDVVAFLQREEAKEQEQCRQQRKFKVGKTSSDDGNNNNVPADYDSSDEDSVPTDHNANEYGADDTGNAVIASNDNVGQDNVGDTASVADDTGDVADSDDDGTEDGGVDNTPEGVAPRSSGANSTPAGMDKKYGPRRRSGVRTRKAPRTAAATKVPQSAALNANIVEADVFHNCADDTGNGNNVEADASHNSADDTGDVEADQDQIQIVEALVQDIVYSDNIRLDAALHAFHVEFSEDSTKPDYFVLLGGCIAVVAITRFVVKELICLVFEKSG